MREGEAGGKKGRSWLLLRGRTVRPWPASRGTRAAPGPTYPWSPWRGRFRPVQQSACGNYAVAHIVVSIAPAIYRRENEKTTCLDHVDHLLRLVLPALVRHAPNFLLQQLQLVLPHPIRVLDERLLCTLGEPRFAGGARLGDNLGEVVALALHAIHDLLLEGGEAGFVKVLELAEEHGRQRRLDNSEEVCALPLVHALVIA